MTTEARMEVIAPERWGRDHYSTLLYLETRCVDHGGRVALASLRCNPARHPYGGEHWRATHVTRLKDGLAPPGHDDWDCIDDLIAAGLVAWTGTGANPRFGLTDAGWAEAHRLRRARADQVQL